jgi:hypothetical protein
MRWALLIGAGVVAAAGFAAQLPEMRRYMKMKRM